MRFRITYPALIVLLTWMNVLNYADRNAVSGAYDSIEAFLRQSLGEAQVNPQLGALSSECTGSSSSRSAGRHGGGAAPGPRGMPDCTRRPVPRSTHMHTVSLAGLPSQNSRVAVRYVRH
jgi:hypothetical protein